MLSKKCAIYTRKSSAEGLEQDFNSLDAQREACEAFIQSQRQEGWQCKKTQYNDGAYSGGTLDRPALSQLLDDITSGEVQVIVVYKVDRLTRSLADFARLIELFDKHDVSFVSVTQQFNTTSSMGRLTLNVLLSFAQFEREITGERIRDKFSASKKKGIWMGGYVPLGYDAEDRKLIINPAEAKTIQLIFTQYLILKNVRALKQYLDSHGIISKFRINRNGDTTGGKPLSRGWLYKMLNNPIYTGQIRHKEKVYPGNHKAIIDEATWEKTQDLLKKNNSAARHGLRAKQPSLLAGKLFDDRGYPMSPNHASKNGKRYRYYTSQAILKQTPEKAGTLPRIPAAEIESVVTKRLELLLTNPLQLSKTIEATVEETNVSVKKAALLVKKFPRHPDKLRNLLEKVTLSDKKIQLSISISAVRTALELEPLEKDTIIELHEKIELRRCRGEAKLIIADSKYENTQSINPPLVKAIARSHVWNQLLMKNEVTSIRELARREEITARYVNRILPLAALAPDIVESILDGSQHPDLTLDTLCDLVTLKWAEQRQILSIPLGC